MKHEKKIIAYIVIFAVVAVIAYALLSSANNVYRKSVAPDEASAKEVSCDITVSNPIGLPLVRNGDLVIESLQCQSQYVSNCARFGVFSDSGSLRLSGEGGTGSATDLKISEHSSQTFNLNWCGSKLTRSVKAKLYDENNGLLQVKEFGLT